MYFNMPVITAKALVEAGGVVNNILVTVVQFPLSQTQAQTTRTQFFSPLVVGAAESPFLLWVLRETSLYNTPWTSLQAGSELLCMWLLPRIQVRGER